jgi:hypothetical protein
MFTVDTTQQIAEQHVADLHAAAAEARLAKEARKASKGPRRSLFAGFRTRTTTVTARPACPDAN